MHRRAISAFAAAAVAAAALASATLPAAASQPSAATNGDITKLIVKFEPGVQAADVNGVVAGTDELGADGQGIKGPKAIGFGYFTVDLPAPMAQASAQGLAKRLEATSKVKVAEIDGTVSIDGTQSNPPSWGLDRIDQAAFPLDSTYGYANDGTGVTAYIVDTGITTGNWTDYQGRRVTGSDQIGDGQNTNDCNGHGSHVAGTVGGSLYGVAKNVTLVAVRVLDCTGSGTWSGVVAGLNWVASNHAAGTPAVMNMSLGGGYSQSVNDAVAAVVTDGVVAAVASGNSNANACNYSPASTPSAITVNATGNYGGSPVASDARASFSNYGSCTDIYAPGVGITSDWNSSTSPTNTISGTSMATPHVTGVAAVILGANPTLTPDGVWTEMQRLSVSAVASGISGDPTRLLQVPTVPPVPTAVSAPTAVTVTPTASQALRVSWTASTGYPAPTYTVNMTSPSASVVCTTTSTSCNATGLTNGTAYTFTVTASNTSGADSASSPASGTAIAPPAAPTLGTLTRSNTGTASVPWSGTDTTAAPVSSFTARAFTSATTTTVYKSCAVTTTPATCISALPTGTTYYVDVIATNAVGSTSSGRQVVWGSPSVPRSVTVAAGSKTATVKWSVPSSNGGSTIIKYIATARKTNSATGTVQATCTTTSTAPSTPATTCTFPANSLPTGTYYVDVQAFNVTTDGALSTRTSVKVA